MAQTVTILSDGASKGSTGTLLKVARIKVANGAGETSTVVDFSTYGITTVLAYGYHSEDTYTTTAPIFMTISGTTVTVTHAGDVGAGVAWAIGI
jgi:hypothetical protein